MGSRNPVKWVVAGLFLLFAHGLATAALAQTPLYRVNAGGPMQPAIGGGPDWDVDTAANPSPYHNTGSSTDGFSIFNTHPSVVPSTPVAVFQSERWDPPGGNELEWDFPVRSGNDYEIRLFFANGYSGTGSIGDRVFDVDIEGAAVLTNYDIVQDVGDQTGVMKHFLVSMSDTNLDVDFFHGQAENPLINAIEILSVDLNGYLTPSTYGLEFGLVAQGATSPPQMLSLTNAGSPGDANIDITNVTVTGDFDAVWAAQTLAPGLSSTLDVTFSPNSIGPLSGTIVVDHTGNNSPLTLYLAGEGFDPGAPPISFTPSVLSGASLTLPTSLQFGPDNRLYVAEQFGLIKVFTIIKNGPSDYMAIPNEVIDLVANIPNHDDDGVLNTDVDGRQVTGLLVTGARKSPVIYVSSSDPRQGGGPSHMDANLDTNSGIISRLTLVGKVWQKQDLVRGLPRSAENHATNGMQLSASGDTLFVASGGHTNMGAPSDNFVNLPEYALSAAILSIDLPAIGTTTYDLPTLDDDLYPGVDPHDPFGGNDGNNQAILDPLGPVQVYSPGWRNAFDLVITQSGKMYTVDNGPNPFWGGEPDTLCSNAPDNGGVHYDDNLHWISGPGYYGGHPNPTRGNDQNTWNNPPQSPVPGSNPIECDYKIPGLEDGALATFMSSTNGIAEYTSSAFGGAMAGDLVTVTYNDDDLIRVDLDASGTTVLGLEDLGTSGVNSNPLDVTTRGDLDPFPGTIWVTAIADDQIVVFEPDDLICSGTYSELLDEDNDGYTNADEIDNDKNPCSAASVPPDWDMDFVSNLNDPDDDNDGILDLSDPFAIDGANGTATAIPLYYDWEASSGGFGGLLDLGFTGLMPNFNTNYEDMFDENQIIPGGATGIVQIDSIPPGDALDGLNDQQNGFQFGINVSRSSKPFTIRVQVNDPFANQVVEDFKSMGMHFGFGTQNAYIKFVLTANGGAGGIELGKETAGNYVVQGQLPLAMPGPDLVDLFLEVDPAALTAEASYIATTGGMSTNRIVVGSTTIPAFWFELIVKPAVGIISTSRGASTIFSAGWEELEITESPAGTRAQAFVAVTPGGGINASTFNTGSFVVTNTSSGNAQIERVRLDLGTGFFRDMVYDPNGTAGDTVAKCFTPDSGAAATGQVPFADNCVDPFSDPHDNGYDVLEVDFTDFDPGETFTFSLDVDPTSIQGVAAPGPNESGSVSGLELTGAQIEIEYSDGTVQFAQLFREPGSEGGGEAIVKTGAPPKPGLLVEGLGFQPAQVSNAAQTLRVSAPEGSDVDILHVEGGLFTAGVPNGGFDLDPFEANSVILVSQQTVVTGADGYVDVPIVLTKTDPDGGLNYIVAVVRDGAGATGPTSNVIILELIPSGQPDLVAVPPSHDFGSINVGSSAVQVIDILHAGTLGDPDITVTDAFISGPYLLEFSDDYSGTTVLTPGQSIPVTVTFAPEFNSSKSAFLEVPHDGTGSPLLVPLSGTGAGGTDPDYLFRVNCGGPQLTALDNGPDWQEDTQANPSSFSNFVGTGNLTFTTDSPNSTGDFIDMSHPSIPATTPVEVFKSERYDLIGPEIMKWKFPVTPNRHRVRLYFSDIFLGTQGDDLREFDVKIEGVLKLDNFDIYEEVGGAAGIVKEFVVWTNGMLNVNFLHEVENPTIKGIEVIRESPQPIEPTLRLPKTAQLRTGLLQNTPNPFNPKTRIQFTLAEAGKASLKIYDVKGRLVSVLVDDALPVGVHTFVWSGQDLRGAPVSTGIYYYTLQVGSFVESRSMILLK